MITFKQKSILMQIGPEALEDLPYITVPLLEETLLHGEAKSKKKWMEVGLKQSFEHWRMTFVKTYKSKKY